MIIIIFLLLLGAALFFVFNFTEDNSVEQKMAHDNHILPYAHKENYHATVMQDSKMHYEDNISHQKKLINLALETITENPILSSDSTQFCIQASRELVRKIMNNYDINFYELHDDDIYTGGIFLLTVSALFTGLTETSFENVSTICILSLFGHEKSNYVNPIVDTYNKAIRENKAIYTIGQNLVLWLNSPTDDQFLKLVQLYKLIKENLK